MSVTLSDSTLLIGETATATINIVSTDGRSLNGRKVYVWSSANPAVATIDWRGTVRAMAPGTTVIIATVNGIQGRANLTVRSPAPVATQLAITQQPGGALSGAVLAPQPIVEVRAADQSLVNTSVIPVTATISSGTGVLAGAVTVSAINGVAVFTNLSITGIGTYTLTFTATALASATSAAITITAPTPPPPPPPPPPTDGRGIVFASDWSTATGTSDAAVMDQGKSSPWTMRGGEGLEVISSQGLDFPSANVLRVTALQATTGFAAVRKTSLSIPAVGTSRYYRWYARVAIGDGAATADQETHPIQDANSGAAANWLFHVYHDATPGHWRAEFRPQALVNLWQNARWSSPPLAKNTTYRFELQMYRATATQFQMHVRVYGSDDVLLYDDASFVGTDGRTTLASNPLLVMSNQTYMDGLNAGLNGLGGSDWFPSAVYMYQGAFAICDAAWCGRYVTGERP